MNALPQPSSAMATHPRVGKKIELNLRRNRQQDQTEAMAEATRAFRYADCQNQYWNPPEFSLLHGTPFWDEASEYQRIILNQLYWVAYYSQIVSAEIATIFFNQTSAAGLYALDDFKLVCDTLDLESAQERTHIHAFRTVAAAVEQALFGRRVFSWPMRGPYAETMIFPDASRLREAWKSLQLRCFGLLSSSNAFIACQYFTVRGLRTLNGKMIQHKLSQFYVEHPHKENAPIPSAISYHHYMDESYHFTSSCVIGTEIIEVIPAPTPFEKMVANQALRGCQRDHADFSAVVRGIFWYEPRTFQAVYDVMTSPVFGLEPRAALAMMQRCFCEENAGNLAAFQTHQTAVTSYQRFLEPLTYVDRDNRTQSRMARASLAAYLRRNRSALRRFSPRPAGPGAGG